ncbi:glycosyltransferase family 4 protein [Lacrimispora sp. 210928-DFI.3.58]|uniref:glycosyltransferase family 4 protein n=1 Tax=Lacrimispora sp. 210928-DFI.3.58 TaxID=2883214 RepID=UPI001D07E67C|nr:glycosyltransferase family 4 protein [Lacrimispora sp. 210928-DFI.3.58]MCB7320079.1 glycosyltransferase family 4 protein [Lacrimispora sp. 210928-DFI.3.58]
MRIAYFSSVLNHHQIELCDCLYKLHGVDFVFVSTMDIEQQRIDLGYKLYDRPYNLMMHTSSNLKEQAEELFQNADVVIVGVFLEEWLQKRLKANKITFLYKERLFKEKPSQYWKIRCQLFVMREYWPHRKKAFYMLAASAFASVDYASLGVFKGKSFAWGYFPPMIQYTEEQIVKNKKNSVIYIFWAGRMLEWKHPEYVLDVAEKLVKEKQSFHIDMAGNGPLLDMIHEEIEKRKLSEYVSALGSMQPENVRRYMEKANIYLFTSNREEGFGAVLTEAMNSGCAVVASETAGATNLLVKDGINGLIYKHDSSDELQRKIISLIADKDAMNRLGIEAYRTILKEQNSSIAAKRFSAVAEAMVNGKEWPVYTSGPMRLME